MNRTIVTRLLARDPGESGRAATPLELFFDLVFVVAVALASQNLHHFESEDHFQTGIVRYAMVFFAIWWAWMNFTWFASAYDSDDWLYRVLTLVQMAGALVMASGVPDAMNDYQWNTVVTGYLVMRLALVVQWLRAAAGDPPRRATALTYAVGISLVQTLWVAMVLAPGPARWGVFVAGVIGELAVPVVAEARARTPWHPHHIAERFGLFTIIVLGESILASSNSIVEGISEAGRSPYLVRLAAAAFVIVASMWWLYFAYPQHHRLRDIWKAIGWGYSHFFIFASAGAVSAGIEVAVDYNTDHTTIGAIKAAATLCVPVALFVFFTWWLVIRPDADPLVNLATPLVAAAIVLAAFLPFSIVITAVLMVGLVALVTWRTTQQPHSGHDGPPSLVEFDA